MAAFLKDSFLHFLGRQRWSLFLYLSAILHLSLFTHLWIKGLKTQEIEICNQPQISLMAQVTPSPKSPHSQEGDQKGEDGGGFNNGPMADAQGKGEGDFAEKFGLKGDKWKEQIDRTEEGETLNDSYSDKDNEKGAINNDVPEEYRKRKRDYRNI
ncbi:MAG TPA: hypothetical protein PLY93_02540, partial [Turneriella sp.]|nr:hypothetical protein [Turneriella sp.]